MWVASAWRGRKASGVRIQRWAALWGLAALTLWALPAMAENATPWVIVQPTPASNYKVDVAQLFRTHLAQKLEGGITVHEPTRDLGAPALAWSVAQAPQRRSLVLMTEELSLLGHAAKSSAQHLSNFIPLLVVLQTRWCLFVKKDSALERPEQLLQWAQHKAQPPSVALPVASGRMRLWVQGMAVRTQRPWEMVEYGVGGDMRPALLDGVDVALGRCDLQERNGDATRILAKGSIGDTQFLPTTAKFTDLGWMPLGDGWLAWMAPITTPHAEREAMAQKLHAIARQPQVQWRLEAAGQVVASMTPEESARYVQTYSAAWHGIGEFLLGANFGDLSKMQGLAMPWPAVPAH